MLLKALIKYSLLWSILLLPVAIAAQDYNYRHYTERDGLVGPTVYTMCQDREGFMWFGTETGVSRFDGTSFKNFTIKDGLPNNEIIRIYADSKGRVWLMPFKYELCYYKNGVIHNRENDVLLKNIKLDELVTEMNETGDGLLLMDSANLFQVNDTAIVNLSNNSFDPRGMVKMQVTRSGKLRMVVSGKIIEYAGGKFTQVDSLPRGSLAGSQIITDDDLKVYVSAPGELHISSGRFNLDYDVKVPPINSIARLNDSLICINSSTGCQVVNILAGKVVTTYLPNKNVNNIFRDREGSIWIATFNDGVYRISSDRFRNLLTAGPNGQKISVYSIVKQGRRLHAGTDMGYFWLDQQENNSFTMERDKEIHSPVKSVTVADDLVVLCNGISIMVKKGTGAFRRILNNNATKQTVVGPLNMLFIAGSNGMRRAWLAPHNWGKLENIGGNRGACVALVGDDVYYGSPDGLHIIPHFGDGFWTTDKPIASDDPLFKVGIRDLKTGSNGVLWMATDNGVVGVKNKKVIRHLTTENGLFSNGIRCICPDGNMLWVGTDKGINRVAINENADHVTRYANADGLASDIVNSITIDGNTVYVATQDGITYFDKHLGNSYSRCDLRLLNVSINGSLVNRDSMPALHYRNSSLHLEYVAVSFKSDGNINYYYRLKELDSTWKHVTQTSLDLISLPPGSFTLELYATNHFGVKSGVVMLPLTVLGPFWQEPWFIALLALVLIALTWAVIQWRLRVIRKKESAERAITHQLHDLEQKALRAQMNPHFIFNCLTSVQEFIIDQDMEAANRYLTRFARLIRQTLDISMLPAITVQDEVRYLTTYLELEQMRFSSGFTFSVTADPVIKAEKTLWPGMVLQPIVENAVYHGLRNLKNREGVLSINFRVEGQMIICEVKDNGVGRKVAEMQKAKGHISWGSRITQQRIDIMNKGISSSIGIAVEDLPGNAGTAVTVRFPLTVSTPA